MWKIGNVRQKVPGRFYASQKFICFKSDGAPDIEVTVTYNYSH